MSTVFTVPHVARPISEDMFADLGVPLVSFDTLADGSIQVTVPTDLTPDGILRGKIRLLTATASAEATLVAAVDALPALDQVRADMLAYAAKPAPTDNEAIAQTTKAASAIAQLAADVHGLIEWVGRDALDLGH